MPEIKLSPDTKRLRHELRSVVQSRVEQLKAEYPTWKKCKEVAAKKTNYHRLELENKFSDQLERVVWERVWYELDFEWRKENETVNRK